MDRLLNTLWTAYSVVNDAIDQDRTDLLARNFPCSDTDPLTGIPPALKGTADVQNPQHVVAMNADLAQKELMATFFQRADFAATESWFDAVATIMKKHRQPTKKLQALCLSHGLLLTGAPRKKLLAIFSLLILAKHTRLP
mgnify:FL=1